MAGSYAPVPIFFRLVAALFQMQPIGGRIAGWPFSPIGIGPVYSVGLTAVLGASLSTSWLCPAPSRGPISHGRFDCAKAIMSLRQGDN
jgi:hypothetical protein